jgi:hypothetical protein
LAGFVALAGALGSNSAELGEPWVWRALRMLSDHPFRSAMACACATNALAIAIETVRVARRTGRELGTSEDLA